MRFVKRGKTLNTAFDEMFEELLEEDDKLANPQTQPDTASQTEAKKTGPTVNANTNADNTNTSNTEPKTASQTEDPLKTDAKADTKVNLDEFMPMSVKKSPLDIRDEYVEVNKKIKTATGAERDALIAKREELARLLYDAAVQGYDGEEKTISSLGDAITAFTEEYDQESHQKSPGEIKAIILDYFA